MPYRPWFIVQADERPLADAEAWLAKDKRVARTERAQAVLWLNGPEQEVLRVQPWSLHQVHAIARDLRRHGRCVGFRFYDVDRQAESTWVHERGMFPMCRLAVGPRGPLLRAAPGEDRWCLDYPDPGLRVVRLSVEVDVQGLRHGWDDPLRAIRVRQGKHAYDLEAAGPDDVPRVLRQLGRLLRRLDPDVLVTHGGDAFDIPYLLHAIRRHRLEHQVRLGRDADPLPDRPDQEAKSVSTYGRWMYKTTAYYLRGRWHVDLAKKSLDSEEPRQDLHGLVYLARIANRRVQDMARNGAGYALQQMQVDHATELGVALPWKRNLAEGWKDAATLTAVDRGGQIRNPTPGLHEHVHACDFSGYYPSLIVRNNLSSDTIGCACCPDAPLVPDLQQHVCRRRPGHQSTVLARVLPHRMQVKALLRRAASVGDVDEEVLCKARAIKSELKAVGVVCFGYFRYRNARFGCAEVHQAIQALGRDGMTRAKAIAESDGFRVVHQMTDCVFLQGDLPRAQARRTVRRIMDQVGVPLDIEGRFDWIVFLPSKTHSTTSLVGVPNRYYGRFEDGSLKVRGIELRRRSNPPFLDDVQEAMLDVLAEARDAVGFHRRIPRALAIAHQAALDLRARRVDPERLMVRMQATKHIEEYLVPTRTKAALQRLRDAGIDVQPGEYVEHVISRRQGAWAGRVRAKSRSTPPPGPLHEHAGGARPSYDVQAYLELLARNVETLLAPFGCDEASVLRWLEGKAPIPYARGHAPAVLSDPAALVPIVLPDPPLA